MAKNVKKKNEYTMGTVWFLAIIVISLLGFIPDVNNVILWMILGICGAVVAILNIQKKEEVSFLVATSSLLVIILFMLVVPEFSERLLLTMGNFLINLSIGFGVAGFVVALGLIARIGLEK